MIYEMDLASVLAAAVTLILTVGLTYLFYPALVVVQGSSSSGSGRLCRVEMVEDETKTATTATTRGNDDGGGGGSDDDDDSAVLLSIVVPSYNEELRLPIMLQEAYDYLTSSTSSSSSRGSSSSITRSEEAADTEGVVDGSSDNDKNENEQQRPLCGALQDLVHVVLGLPTETENDTESMKKKQKNQQQQSPRRRRVIVVEWIVVDDGSSDQTGQAFGKFVQRRRRRHVHFSTATTTTTTSTATTTSSTTRTDLRMRFVLVTLRQNAGKGAAVQTGMLVATGAYRLMVDADGATDFAAGLSAMTQELRALQQQQQQQKQPNKAPAANHNNNTIWLGSRLHLQPQQQSSDNMPAAERTLIRRLLSLTFTMLRTLTLGRQQEIVDTQCGFKLFPAEAAQTIFRALHLQRWAFDIEVLYLALHSNYPVREVLVPWQEVEGSKLNTSPLNLALVSLSMLRDMICVRLCYLLGIWSIHDDNATSLVTGE